ncbi:MAG: hypothetical protein Q4E43_09530, partial [Akkermansia sp.]|nr:hypothetical protein [Akkermansia sp.]
CAMCNVQYTNWKVRRTRGVRGISGPSGETPDGAVIVLRRQAHEIGDLYIVHCTLYIFFSLCFSPTRRLPLRPCFMGKPA